MAESYEILWNSVLPQLEHEVSQLAYDMYIKVLQPVDIMDNKLVLITSNALFANAVSEGSLKETIKNAIITTNTSIADFEVYTANSKDEYYKTLALSGKDKTESMGAPINPKFTFDSYVIGNCNELTAAAAKAVAEAPGEAYNPLFIYGGTGLGKTHLLMAIANYIKVHSPALNVLYATCEQFTNQFVASLSKGKTAPQDFRNKFRNVDVLLIDDLQDLAHKEATQAEFFHTFDELVSQNKQIVLTCDRPPKEIDILTDRLRTRFESGLLSDVQPPDLETRIAILKKKSEEKKTIIDIKVLTYIAEMADNDIRSLIGKLTKVIFASKLHEKPITIELVNEALKESVTEVQEELKVEDIINCVADFYKIPKNDILGKKKNKEFVEPRQICIYLITDLMSLPLITIGQKMGGRDHTTVIYARDKITEQMKQDDRLATEINDIKNMLLKR